MQVITGKFKGRKLSTVPDLSVRPATHRVKSAIFNILQSRVHWSSATVLDLYAGSGSIGIEALSRGATHVTFVENDKRVADFLKKNITKIGATNECDILLLSVEQFLERPRQSFDVIFVDPPYALQTLSSLPLTIFQKNLVKDNGYMIMEHPASTEFPENTFCEIVLQRKYGRTTVSFFQKKSQTT